MADRHDVPGRQCLTRSCWMCRTQWRAAELTEHCCPLLACWGSGGVVFLQPEEQLVWLESFLFIISVCGEVNMSKMAAVLSECQCYWEVVLSVLLCAWQMWKSKPRYVWGWCQVRESTEDKVYHSGPCLSFAIRTCNWCHGWNLPLCVEWPYRMKLLLLDLPGELIFAFAPYARGDEVLCSEYTWKGISVSRAAHVLGHRLAFDY